MQLSWLAAGFCWNLEGLTRQGRPLRPTRYPAGFALIEHPQQGPILFDTGYHPRVQQVTRRFPAKLYELVTPMRIEAQQSAVAQLKRLGFAAHQVKHIVISHFHADHVAGLLDFPQARFYYSAQGYNAVASLRGLAAVRKAFLPELLPPDFVQRSVAIVTTPAQPLPLHLPPFTHGVDVLGDGLLWAIDLPGHALGQLGLLALTNAGPQLLVADAAWSLAALQMRQRPHPITRAVFANPAQEAHTFRQVAAFVEQHPHVPVYPSHCPEVLERYGRKL